MLFAASHSQIKILFLALAILATVLFAVSLRTFAILATIFFAVSLRTFAHLRGISTSMLRLMLGHYAALLGFDVGEFHHTLLTIAYVCSVPIRRPSAKNTSDKENFKVMLAGFEGDLGAVVTVSRDKEVTIVNEHLSIKP